MLSQLVVLACVLIASCAAAPTATIIERNETIITITNTTMPLIRHRRQATLDSETMRAILLNAVPGVDYPAFDKPPLTSFQCAPSHGVLPKGGYYADMQAGCASFHICANGYDYAMMCPKQTLFNQRTLTCDWFFEVNCPSARDFYAISNQDVFTFAQHQFYPGNAPQAQVVYSQSIPSAIPPQQFADAATSSDAINQQQQQQLPCCDQGQQQQPSGMLVLHDQVQQNTVSPQAIVILFVPATAPLDTSNFVNIVQPAEQISSQSMSDAIKINTHNLNNDNIQQQKKEDCVKTNDNAVQQDALPQMQQQVPMRSSISQQQSSETSDFIRQHQQARDNQPLSDLNVAARSDASSNNNVQSQQHEKVKLRESSHFATSSQRSTAQQDSMKKRQQQPLSDVSSSSASNENSQANTAQQIPAQQQRIPIQQQQQQQAPMSQGFGGGLGTTLGATLPGQPGVLLGSMMSGISQPGGVFSLLGQLMNTGPQVISNVLPMGTQFQTLLVPQAMGASQQPAYAVLNNCCQV